MPTRSRAPQAAKAQRKLEAPHAGHAPSAQIAGPQSLKMGIAAPGTVRPEVLAQLQRTYGNQAVQRLISERHAPSAVSVAARRPALQRLSVTAPAAPRFRVRRIQRTPATVQRADEPSAPTATMEQTVAAQVGALPDISEESIPSPDEVEAARKKGEEARAEVTEVAGSNPAVQAAVLEDLAATTTDEGGGESASPAPVSAPAPSSAPESEPSGNASNVSSKQTGNSVKSTLGIGKAISGIGNSATTPVVEVLGAAKEAVKTTAKITGAIGVVFAGLQGLLDIRSAISSGITYRNLRQIADKARAEGHDPDVVAAVEYAMQQKYSKAINRAISFIASMTSLGVGIAVLAGAGAVALLSNPAGWGVLTIMAAIGLAIGISLVLWKLGRWFYKRFVSGEVRHKRHGFAARLYQKGIWGGDAVALAAIAALGLKPADLKAAAIAARGKPNTKAENASQAGHLAVIDGKVKVLTKKIEEKKKLQMAELREANRSSTPSLIKRHNESAAAYAKKIKGYEEQIKMLRGEREWKVIPKRERDVVRLIFKKLGSK